LLAPLGRRAQLLGRVRFAPGGNDPPTAPLGAESSLGLIVSSLGR